MLPPSDPQQLGHFVDHLRRNGWIPVPLAHRSKQPAPEVRRWKGRSFSGAVFEAMVLRNGPLGIGFRLDNLVVIDIDADDETEANRIAILAEHILGPTPAIRVGRPPRRQLIYQAPPGGVERWSEHSVVECLTGEAAYVVGFNLHPETGRPFTWVGEDEPQDLRVKDLPVVENEAVLAFRSAVMRRPFASGVRSASLSCKPSEAQPTRAGRITDGREQHLTELVAAAIGAAKAAGRELNRQDLIAEVWTKFASSVDLRQPKRGGGAWSRQDVERKVDYALRPSRSARIRPAQAKGFWTFARKCALRRLIDADPRLTDADRAVGWAMIEAVRDERGLSFQSSATLAQQTGLHGVTVRTSRRRLNELGYFTEVRKGGQNRPTVCAPNRQLVDAVPASTAPATLAAGPNAFSYPTPANDVRPPQAAVRAEKNPKFVASPTTIILTRVGVSETRDLVDLFGRAPDPRSFGRWVREQRYRLGLSQRALGQLIGCTQAHVANVERGHDSLSSWSNWRLRELAGEAA